MQTENLNEELQNDDEFLETEYEEYDDVEPDDDGEPDSGSDPDSDTEHEAKGGDETLDDFSKEKVNERFGKITRQRAEAERRAEAAEKRLKELERQALEASRPVVPELPDPDEVSEAEFAQAVQQRDEAVRRHIQWQTQQQYYQQQEYQQQQQQILQQQQEVAKAAQVYNQRAKAFKIKPEELQAAGSVINQIGLNDDLATHILNDEQGALITMHLGNNVQDLIDIAGMNPVQAALYIERNIKPRLARPKRKSTTTRPPSRVKGGTPDKNERYPLSGRKATFE